MGCRLLGMVLVVVAADVLITGSAGAAESEVEVGVVIALPANNNTATSNQEIIDEVKLTWAPRRLSNKQIGDLFGSVDNDFASVAGRLNGALLVVAVGTLNNE